MLKIRGWCCDRQLCRTSVCLIPSGVQSFRTLGWGTVGVGCSDGLAVSCGDSASSRACFDLQGGDISGVRHPSHGALRVPGWRMLGRLRCQSGGYRGGRTV